jgi:tetratricopeptide (TPR) repeat protein
VREGRPRRALEQYERSAALRPTPLAYLRIAQLRVQERDWEGALSAYERGLALRPDGAHLLRGAALAASRLGRQDQARSFRERSHAVD